jgi:hypothetical protein
VAAIGKAIRKEMQVSLPSIQAYARSTGAELVVPDLPENLPVPAVKFAAVQSVRDYDRIMWLDSDVIVRPGCPDLFRIVPKDRIGAWPEGERYPRGGWTKEALLRNAADPDLFPSHEYFNSGVMVFSREHFSAFDLSNVDALNLGPQFDQSYLNVAIRKAGTPVYLLTQDFNFIPSIHTRTDWRFAWIVHAAGDSPGLQRRVKADHFRGQVGRTRLFFPADLLGRHLRLVRLMSYWREFNGAPCLAFDPDQMDYASAGRLVVWDDETAYSLISGRPGEPAACGPRFTLNPGRYEIDFLVDAELSNAGYFSVEVSADGGGTVAWPRTRCEAGRTAEFTIGARMHDMNILLYVGDGEVFSQGVLLTRIGD